MPRSPGRKISFWGEVTRYGEEVDRWRFLTFVHIFGILFFIAYWIVFLILLVGVNINLWLTFITWGVIGFLLLIGLQLIAYTNFLKTNTISFSDGTSESNSPMTITGTSYIREMSSAFAVSAVAWVIGLILQGTFLFGFKNDDPGEGCCAATPENLPDLTDPVEWRSFSNMYLLVFATCMAGIWWLFRVIIADYHPLFSVGHIIARGKKQT
jgi:hypothetical protein